MSNSRRLAFFCVASIVFAALVGALDLRHSVLRYIVQALMAHTGTDSSRFMDQAWSTLNQGQPLYGSLFFQQHVKFIYPPSSMLTYLVAQALHVRAGLMVKIIELVSFPATLAIAGEVYLLSCPAAEREPNASGTIRALVALLGLFFYPLVYGACLGQIQTLLTFLWTSAVYFWIRERKAMSGLCLALICVFKPPLAAFLVWGLLRREWRFVASFAGAVAAIQIVTVACFGWRNELDYIAVLRFISHRGEAFIPNQTFNGLLQRLVHNGNMLSWSDTVYPPYRPIVYLGTLISSAILFLLGLFAPLARTGISRSLDFILFGLISTLASPIAWEHHYGFFFVGCIYFLALHLNNNQRGLYLFFPCFLVLANSWNFLSRLATTSWNPLLSYDLFAGLGVILLLALTRQGGRPETAITPGY